MWINEIVEFKKAMQKVREKIIGEAGTVTWEFYGGVSTVQDIDDLQFYAGNYQLFPNFDSIIRKILGTNAASTSCEHVNALLTFNYAGIVLNCRRGTSLSTDIADILIVNVLRHKNALRSSKLKVP